MRNSAGRLRIGKDSVDWICGVGESDKSWNPSRTVELPLTEQALLSVWVISRSEDTSKLGDWEERIMEAMMIIGTIS